MNLGVGEVGVGLRPLSQIGCRASSGSTGAQRAEGTEKRSFSGVPWSGGLATIWHENRDETWCAVSDRSF
jgi:hypothetical protein